MASENLYLIRRNEISKIFFSFIWNYKNGDNILYNFDVLNILYKSRFNADVKDRQSFNKPITLIISSIIECIIVDFIDRIKGHRRELIPNLSEKQIRDCRYKGRGKDTREKRYKEFNHFIQAVQKNEIFGEEIIIYRALDFLRKIRNRIHIQNSHNNDLPKDEIAVFTDKNLELAETLLDIITKKMLHDYYRPHREDVTGINTNIFPW